MASCFQPGKTTRPAQSRAYSFCATCFELVALDDVADLIFAEIAELDAAFEPDADFLHVVLETAQGGKTAIVNRLASRAARARGRSGQSGHR